METLFLIGFLPNPRICKRIQAASEYSNVHLVCWDRRKNMIGIPQDLKCDMDIISISAGGDPLKRLIPYALFRKKALEAIRKISPDILHVQGLDMLEIAHHYQKRFNHSVKLIYEVADLHRLLVDSQTSLPAILAQRYLLHKDRVRCRNIDMLIVTAQTYYDTYFKHFVPVEKLFYFPNVPDLRFFSSYQPKNPEDPFTVGYIGGIRYKSQIHDLLTAAQDSGCSVLLAGFENGEEEVRQRASTMENVEWVGRFDFQEKAAALYSKCDIIHSVYNADMANVRVALPNKLYEAIACGIPIIAARGTYLAQLVESWGVGFAVDHRGPEELKTLLCYLQNHPEEIERCARNCASHRAEFDLSIYNDKLKDRILALKP